MVTLSGSLAGALRMVLHTGWLPTPGTQIGEIKVYIFLVDISFICGVIYFFLSPLGYFKIIRGRNEVGIESGIYGGIPKN